MPRIASSSGPHRLDMEVLQNRILHLECQSYERNFSKEKATIIERQNYAKCINILYPPQIQSRHYTKNENFLYTSILFLFFIFVVWAAFKIIKPFNDPDLLGKLFLLSLTVVLILCSSVLASEFILFLIGLSH